MNALKMKWGLCSHFNPLISFLGKKKLRKPNYIFNPKMVNLFQYKTKHHSVNGQTREPP
jgi:hypothetical protein